MLHKDFKWVIAPSSLINNSELKRFKILIQAKIHIPSRNSIMDAHISAITSLRIFYEETT